VLLRLIAATDAYLDKPQDVVGVLNNIPEFNVDFD
jgi:hypothetical protein